VKNAMDRLVENGIIRRSFYKKNGRRPMLIEIMPERFKEITRFKNSIA
jgi:DNA-binding MarR family transcriptional regulator